MVLKQDGAERCLGGTGVEGEGQLRLRDEEYGGLFGAAYGSWNAASCAVPQSMAPFAAYAPPLVRSVNGAAMRAKFCTKRR